MFENKSTNKTKLSELGEFGLIRHLTKNIEIKNKSTKKGIGDDSAVLKFEEEVLISTDLLIENVHFNLAYCPLKHLGYKAVVINLSDIYAMNGTASQVTISLAVSNRFGLEAVEELYSGMLQACKTYGVDLIGGDTTSSQTGLTISVTAIGHAKKKNIVFRSGAKPNDLLVVSGDIGASFLGFKILERENEVFKVNPNSQPDLESYSYLIERQLKPEARKDIPILLKALDTLPTSMIDISDGLASETLHLCHSSNVGCKLYEDKLPLDPQMISTCEEFNIDSSTIALSGGEDYELLFTISMDDFPKIKGNPNLTMIGHITDQKEGKHFIGRSGNQIPLTAQGWDALFKKNKDE